jgi:hypothetical protein
MKNTISGIKDRRSKRKSEEYKLKTRSKEIKAKKEGLKKKT